MANGFLGPTEDEIIRRMREWEQGLPPEEQALKFAPMPGMQATPAAPEWLERAAGWLEEPGYARGMVTPGAGLVSYARDVARGEQMHPLETAMAGLDVPVPGAGTTGKTLGALGGALGHTVYHGTPYMFDAFKKSKLSTGAGGQWFGHGLYFAEDPDVARAYKVMVSEKKPEEIAGYATGQERAYLTTPASEMTPRQLAIMRTGQEGTRSKAKASLLEEAELMKSLDAPELEQMYRTAAEESDRIDMETLRPITSHLYTVDVPDEAVPYMLDWDKPMSAQPAAVQSALRELASENETGEQFYRRFAEQLGSEEAASDALMGIGIPGMWHTDPILPGEGRNLVLFDEEMARIVGRE